MLATVQVSTVIDMLASTNTSSPPAQRRTASWDFAREAFRDWRHTGAVAPSSAALAAQLSAPLLRHDSPIRVLEVGAGTGVVTSSLLARLPRSSDLDVVELNPHFRPRLDRIAAAAQHARVEIHTSRIENAPLEGPYDCIVSGLPMTNFSPELASDIMTQLLGLLTDYGTMTYFAYLGTGTARRFVGSRAQARRHHEVEQQMRHFHATCSGSASTVWMNLPPAKVWTLVRRPDHANVIREGPAPVVSP
ncbi:class I SAM-dependent methyltransferase [Mycolicibacterium sp. BiH015]|uniref:class I SAM-dependent methyltransferase n=1 Tax=Mycolicibacterium sp. BiH015 TaxID=3018808 RepID=UPI003FA602B5